MRRITLISWTLLAACSGDPEVEPTTPTGPTTPLPDTVVIVDPNSGDPELGSADSIAFAPAGHLIVGDGALDRLVVVQTADLRPDDTADDFERVANLPKKVADALGVDENDILIEDIEVNPLSGRVYVAVERFDVDYAGIFTVEPDGSAAPVDLATMPWVSVDYPEVGGLGSVVTDLEWAETHIVAAVTELSWTTSQVVTVASPVSEGQQTEVTSTRTYHRSHGQWETFAPITTLFAYADQDGSWIGASYQCAPVVRFQVADLAAGDAEVVGVTPFDYGGGRQVLAFAVGVGEDPRVYASVSNLGGTSADPSLFLETTEVDEAAPVVFGFSGEPTVPSVAAAAKLDDRNDLAVLDASRLVVYTIGGELEIVDNPQ